jgi:hypothetical protein
MTTAAPSNFVSIVYLPSYEVHFLAEFADDVVDEGVARREQRDETGSISVHHANDRPAGLGRHAERCLLRPVDVEVEFKGRRQSTVRDFAREERFARRGRAFRHRPPRGVNRRLQYRAGAGQHDDAAHGRVGLERLEQLRQRRGCMQARVRTRRWRALEGFARRCEEQQSSP